MTALTDHFLKEELWCPTTHQTSFAPCFLRELERLRAGYGKPMTVTSCCRSAAHNDRIGGHPRSLHLMDNKHHGCATCAIDISMTNSADRGHLISCAWNRGWAIGVAKGFLHLDLRLSVLGMPQIVYVY